MIAQIERRRSGFTLVELVVTFVAAGVVILGIVSMIAYSHQGYNRLFKRINRGVVPQAYEARLIFDRIVRKSSIRRHDLRSPRNGGYDQVYVYYYSNPQDLAIVDPDRYGWFYLSGTQLWLEQGNVTGGFDTAPPGLPALSPTMRTVVADNVAANAGDPGIFSMQGSSVRMALMLDSETTAQASVSKIETLKMTVTTTALPHNR